MKLLNALLLFGLTCVCTISPLDGPGGGTLTSTTVTNIGNGGK